MSDGRPTLTCEQHLALFAERYPFAEFGGSRVLSMRYRRSVQDAPAGELVDSRGIAV